jgi:hypothetical protein
VASVNLVRLSLKKAAYVAVDWCSVVGNPEFAPNEQKIKPIESISIFSVHFTLNLPQASQFLGMTKCGVVTFIRSRRTGWTEKKQQVPVRLRAVESLP